MKYKGTRESYYAVRIGIPGRHTPYFMIDSASSVNLPIIFETRDAATKYLAKAMHVKYGRVVKVHLTDKLAALVP